jgi:transketolase
MRQQFPNTVHELMKVDDRIVLLFGDVGTYGFRFSATEFPDRVYNVGILEQSMISIAAGVAMQGLIPVVHTIAAFLVERAFEQIKDDFGYQKLGGNFVSIGGSYDLASWGCTHEAPSDVGLVKNIPEAEIVVPGTPAEFDALFKEAYDNGHPTYFRLSAKSNAQGYDVKFGKANVVKRGSQGTVLAVGPMLDRVLQATEDLDVTVLYYTTLAPFDHETLRANIRSDSLIVCEPYYSGACAEDIAASLRKRPTAITYIGVPREFPHHYGSGDDIDAVFRLTASDLRERIVDALTSDTPHLATVAAR